MQIKKVTVVLKYLYDDDIHVEYDISLKPMSMYMLAYYTHPRSYM